MNALFNTTKRDYARTIVELMSCVRHPSFRLGAIDASKGKSLDHDDIRRRVAHETPASGLQGLDNPNWWDEDLISLAQRRYEEGRLLVIQYGLTFKGYNHPLYPPAQICRLIERLAVERAARRS